MQLLVHIGRAYQALSNFDLGKAIRLFRSLEHHQLQTSWVLEKIAQAYFAAERFNKVWRGGGGGVFATFGIFVE